MAESRWKTSGDFFALYRLGAFFAIILWLGIREFAGDYLGALLVVILVLGCIGFGVFLKRLRDKAYGHTDGSDVVYRKKESKPPK